MPRFVVARHRERREAVPLAEAIALVKACRRRKFDQSVDLAINLGIDPRRGDQMVRGATSLPHGTGRSVRVCVFARDGAAAEARAAGAEVVGDEVLIADIQQAGGGGLAFDKCIATPDMMPRLGKIARILGPRGLMPNPKLGTVTSNVAEAVGALSAWRRAWCATVWLCTEDSAHAKRGRVEFRADKGGVLHAGVGKISFADDALHANIAALAAALMSARPKGVKGSGAGGYLLTATLSSTMGPGIPVAIPSIVAAAQAAKSGR